MSSLYLQSADYSASASILCRDQNLFGAYSCETIPLPEMTTNQFTRINFGNDGPTTMAMPKWRFAKSTDFSGATTTASSSCKPKTAIAVRLLSRLIEGKDGEFTATKKNSVRAQKGVKRVSFSDEMGLALTSVRTFSSSLSCPFPDSEERRPYNSVDQSPTTCRVPTFVLNFRQPQSCMSTFLENLERNSVQLGSVAIKDGIILGEIVVKNLAYEKTVFVRYSGSDWRSFTDVHASYVFSRPELTKCCCPGSCDVFEFQFPVPVEVNRDGCVEFAVCYEVGGRTFWDNNNNGANGKNYRVTKVFFDRPSTALRSFQNHEVYAATRSNSTTDHRTVFDVFQRTAVDWSEFTGRKNGFNCTLPYW